MSLPIDIPPELWYHIVSYLTDAEVWPLRNTNRTLRVVAWDRQCKQLYLDTLEMCHDKFWKNIRRLHSPHIINRVRELVFSRGEFLPSIFWQILVRDNVGITSAVKNRFLDFSESRENFMKRMLADFTSVVSLRITCMHSSNHMVTMIPQIRFIEHALGCYAPHLRSLSISLPSFEVIEKLLGNIQCPQLNSFSLSLSTPLKPITIPSQVRSHVENVLLPFLNKHARTLTSFEFKSSIFIPGADIAQYLDRVHQMPNLRHFELSLATLTLEGQQPLHQFLTNHGASLHNLILRVPLDYPGHRPRHPRTTPGLLAESCTSLPQLTKLIIELPNNASGPSNTQLVEFANQYAPTLLCLELHRRSLKRSDWELLTSTSWARLTTLSIVLLALRPLDMDTIATKFTSLESLTLEVSICIGNQPESTSGQFAVEMAKRSYTGVNLRYLTFPRPSLKEHLPVLALAFPTLLLLNEEPRHSYIGDDILRACIPHMYS